MNKYLKSDPITISLGTPEALPSYIVIGLDFRYVFIYFNCTIYYIVCHIEWSSLAKSFYLCTCGDITHTDCELKRRVNDPIKFRKFLFTRWSYHSQIQKIIKCTLMKEHTKHSNRKSVAYDVWFLMVNMKGMCCTCLQCTSLHYRNCAVRKIIKVSPPDHSIVYEYIQITP